MSTSTPPRTTRTLEPDLPAIRVLRRTTRSFDIQTGSWEALVSWLTDVYRFRPVQLGDSGREWARLRGGQHDGQLLIIYKSGALLCQGADATKLARLLDQFAVGPSIDQCEMFDYSGEVVA